MYVLYLSKAAETFGVVSTREIYEEAISLSAGGLGLNDDECREMCMRYAAMESGLGEIARARAIYGHAAPLADPRTVASFWATWQDFETRHGDEGTFREMLRIKRSVQAQYADKVPFVRAKSEEKGETAVEDQGVNEEEVELVN